MSKLILDISVSLDGCVAGPDQSLDEPLGRGGERLHDWAFATEAFQEMHGRGGGEQNADSDLAQELIERTGASIMGRRMFSGGSGPWGDDPRADGWWGDEPPFKQPVFVLTHHEREPLSLGETTFFFVTEGPERALELARDASGGKDVAIGGGAQAAQQYLRAGLVDEMQLHVVPVILGPGGEGLLEDIEPGALDLRIDRVLASPSVTHLRYSAVR